MEERILTQHPEGRSGVNISQEWFCLVQSLKAKWWNSISKRGASSSECPRQALNAYTCHKARHDSTASQNNASRTDVFRFQSRLSHSSLLTSSPP